MQTTTTIKKAKCNACEWQGDESELVGVNPNGEKHFTDYYCPKCNSVDVEVEEGENLPMEQKTATDFDTAEEYYKYLCIEQEHALRQFEKSIKMIESVSELDMQIIKDQQEKIDMQGRRINEYTTITRHLEDIAVEWQDSYNKLRDDFDHAQRILVELVALKRMKDQVGKTKDYLTRQPLVWKAAEKYVVHRVKPSQMVYMDALIDVEGKFRDAVNVLSSLVDHYQNAEAQPGWVGPVRELLAALALPAGQWISAVRVIDIHETSLHAISIWCDAIISENMDAFLAIPVSEINKSRVASEASGRIEAAEFIKAKVASLVELLRKQTGKIEPDQQEQQEKE